MLTDIASIKDLKEKFDDLCEESPPYKCRAQVTAHFPIGRSFERHKIAFTENNNRAEDYSTGFIIDYAHAQTNEQPF
jgi:hypothetical protein